MSILNIGMSTICTPATRVAGGERTSPGLYFLGGLQPPENSPYELRMEYVLKQVYKYDTTQVAQNGKRHTVQGYDTWNVQSSSGPSWR